MVQISYIDISWAWDNAIFFLIQCGNEKACEQARDHADASFFQFNIEIKGN